MYHIDGLYLGQYSNLPERNLQTKTASNTNSHRKGRVTRTRRIGAKGAGETTATIPPVSKGASMDVDDDDYWYHYTSVKESKSEKESKNGKKGKKGKKEDKPSYTEEQPDAEHPDSEHPPDVEEPPEVEEPEVEEPGHGGGTASEDFGLDFYEPLFFHPIGEWVGAEFSIKLVSWRNFHFLNLNYNRHYTHHKHSIPNPIVLYLSTRRILTMKVIPKTFSTFATFTSTCRDASSCSKMAYRSIQTTRLNLVTCTTSRASLMPSAAALDWTVTSSLQLYGELCCRQSSKLHVYST
jgi:hypothetical protein